jgi:hypothetical protein
MHDYWAYQRFEVPSLTPRQRRAGSEVVTRHVLSGAAPLARQLERRGLLDPRRHVGLGAGGRLEITRPLQPVDGLLPTWRARGRLRGRGPRLVPFARVEIEIVARSPTTAAVRLLPVHRHPFRWGVSRQRRYFDLAHAAADHIARLLTEPVRARGCEPDCPPLELAA